MLMMCFIFLSWQLVVIVDPHIKVDPTYTLYSQAKDKGYFVKDRNGQDFEGICWPGKKTLCCYISGCLFLKICGIV